MIQFIITQKTNKAKGIGGGKKLVTNRKRSDAPVTFTKGVNVKYRTDNMS